MANRARDAAEISAKFDVKLGDDGVLRFDVPSGGEVARTRRKRWVMHQNLDTVVKFRLCLRSSARGDR